MTTKIRPYNPKPGWLARQFANNQLQCAIWPQYMRDHAGFDDADLTPEQRKEAAKILRARADELDPEVPRG